MAVSQKAVMPNALETGRQGVKQKTPLELIHFERHRFRLLAVFAAIVFPLKRDTVIFEREQSTIGDGYPMRVTAQIFQRSLRSAEWRFGVNHPVAIFVRAQQCIEDKG